VSRILIPGRTCAAVFDAPRSGMLVDGCDYYRELYRAALLAERSILIAGWQLDSEVPLLYGADAESAEYPVELVPFLSALCDERPELEVHVLAWDHSPVFVFEREPLQARAFNRAHERIHYLLDAVHPVGASHHQKLVVIDRAVAFLGSMDICTSRWDDHCHRAGDERRTNRLGLAYGPYHEAQAYVTGEAVDVLRGWFGERWQRASGQPFAAPSLWHSSIDVTPTVEVSAPSVALSRTQPALRQPPIAPIAELRALYVEAIMAARQAIYIENQYFTSEDVYQALLERLSEPARPPLEIVLVLPEKPEALKERLALGIRQARLLRELADVASASGHHLGIFYSVDPAPDGEGEDVPVYMHSKVLSVDDRFLHVGSANTTNRSMGVDTELGISWEARHTDPSIRTARMTLLSEHTGLRDDQAAATFGELAGLVDRLEALAADRKSRLRRTELSSGEGIDLIEKLLPAEINFDPKQPFLDEALWQAAEGDDSSWLDRLSTAWRHLRAAL